MAREPRVLGIVLAGGEGKRLWPLTADRAKPAVPFGGNYRLIDFVLSNLVNAGYLRICVLTQYKSHSLDRHITQTWRMSTVLGNYITPVPAQQRLGPRWYTGSADAILQSANLIYDDKPDYIIVFGADHVYRMDPRQMVDAAHRVRRRRHRRRHPGAAQPRPPRSASSTPTPTAASSTSWRSRPTRRACPTTPTQSYASMGNYVFTTEALLEALKRGRRRRAVGARHGHQHHADDGQEGRRLRLRLRRQRRPRRRGPRPRLLARRRDDRRLLRRAHGPRRRPPDLQPLQPAVADLHLPPAAAAGEVRRGRHRAGVDRRRRRDRRRRDGAAQRDRARTCRLAAGAYVEGSVLMDGVQIGRGAVVRKAILDKDVVVPEGAHIGLDPELDRAALPRLRGRRRGARQEPARACPERLCAERPSRNGRVAGRAAAGCSRLARVAAEPGSHPGGHSCPSRPVHSSPLSRRRPPPLVALTGCASPASKSTQRGPADGRARPVGRRQHVVSKLAPWPRSSRPRSRRRAR